jgi:hypothetical protein
MSFSSVIGDSWTSCSCPIRVVSWIVLFVTTHGNDPRNNTKGHEKEFNNVKNDRRIELYKTGSRGENH